ncbi:carbon storage regulator [Pseudomonas sp.]
MRDGITVTISEVTREGKVRLSIEAPDSVLILRDELEFLT